MDPHGKFLPPKNDEEFEERAKDLTLAGAESVLGSLESRRAGMVQNIDEEIAFYKKVVRLRETEVR